MRHLILIILGVMLFACCTPAKKPETTVTYQKRLLVAVGDIQNQTDDTNYDSILDPLTGSFIDALQKTGCFRLVERQRLKSVLEELKLGMAGLTDPSQSKEIGKLLGVDAILLIDLTSVVYENDKKSVGSFIERGSETFKVISDARLVAVDTGEIYASSSHSVTLENSYEKVGSIMNGQMADKKAMVQEAMQKSVEFLAHDISSQVPRN